MKNELTINQPIPFHTLNKRVRNAKMIDYLVPQTKNPINV